MAKSTRPTARKRVLGLSGGATMAAWGASGEVLAGAGGLVDAAEVLGAAKVGAAVEAEADAGAGAGADVAGRAVGLVFAGVTWRSGADSEADGASIHKVAANWQDF